MTPIKNLRWWIAGLLALATALNYLDRQSFPVVVGEVRKEIPISNEQYGHLTSAFLLELIFVAYLMVRKFGGPGSEKLAAATALFGTATAPFVYKSVDIWRTVHPNTNVVRMLGNSMPGAGRPFAVSSIAFILLFGLLLTLRVRLARQQSALDELYLAHEDR